MTAPDIVFIVPFRNRAPQKKVFESVMPLLLVDYNYKILFIHQKDSRPFNRGAMKNLGFIYVQRLWPNAYKKMTLVFHDIDYMSHYKDQFNYTTKKGVVKHFFGYKWTLGGIVSINAEDFEKTNGFPNIWTWGLEDNILQKRCIKAGLNADRSNFLQGGRDEDQLITLWHGWNRLIDPSIQAKWKAHSNIDGITIIKNIQYNVENIKENVDIVHITHFKTGERAKIAAAAAKELHAQQNGVFYDRNDRNKRPIYQRKKNTLFPNMKAPRPFYNLRGQGSFVKQKMPMIFNR